MGKVTSVKLITLGCSKNTVDSEKLLGSLNIQDVKLKHITFPEPCDFILVNTCGFIESAKSQSVDTILECVKLKKSGSIKKILVFGCFSERYKTELIKEIPEVDYFFGIKESEAIRKVISNNKPYTRSSALRLLSTPKHYAYIKISDGCNRKCSFCAIPSIKGKYRSTPEKIIINEAESLVTQGAKELILVAQDLPYYGIDINKKPALAGLLEKLSEINGVEWIRLHYLYHRYIDKNLIRVIATNPKICKYIDLPIQHISDRMLKIMRRGIDKKTLTALLIKIREIIPDAAIRTTVLTGHPGETGSDFKELCRFIGDFEFDRLGVFQYSHEEGTFSWKNYRDNVNEKTRNYRESAIMELQKDISLRLNLKKTGTIQKVIIDSTDNDYYRGRTQYDSPDIDNEVIIKGNNLKTGEFYDVRITGTSEYDLRGEFCF